MSEMFGGPDTLHSPYTHLVNTIVVRRSHSYAFLCVDIPINSFFYLLVLYSPFPSNWPKFTSKDKMANWMEQYAENQELVVWTSSTLDSKPVYDRNTKKWNVAIRRNGITVVLHPSHLVFAIGIFGDPNVPSLTGVDDFRGDILHSSVFTGGQPFSGKRVIVVGAGNTSADICQDLVYRGAASVTMLQRSATSVLSDKLLAIRFDPVFAEDRPIEYSDLASAGLPINCLRELNKKLQPLAEEFDKELHNGLKKAGFKLTNGPDHSGQLLMVYDRGGGVCHSDSRYLDV